MFNKIRSVMIGHAIGDALGVPVEFCSRKYLEKHPVTKMLGFGMHNVPKGTWSDDTSMSLCALKSLSNGVVDYDDIMNNFCMWYYNDEFTATGSVFDVGNTCANAIATYYDLLCPAEKCGENDEMSNGNGSLMRIHPFVLYAYYNKMSDDEFIDMITKASSLTHAHQYSIDGCLIYAYVLRELLNDNSITSIYKGLEKSKDIISSSKVYDNLLTKDISKERKENIKSSGYVVDSLEAAIWCLLTTKNYSDCVLKAVNLGVDTDTIAAIAGSLAGALYGLDNIPKTWIEILKREDYIENICKDACEIWG